MEDMKKYVYTERADLFDPNIYIEFLIKIKGNPSVQMLETAINQAYYVNEVTMCKSLFMQMEVLLMSL